MRSASIFTRSGAAARAFSHAIGGATLGINVGFPAAMPCFPFSGSGGSFGADPDPHGHDAIRFFTDARVIVSRWT